MNRMAIMFLCLGSLPLVSQVPPSLRPGPGSVSNAAPKDDELAEPVAAPRASFEPGTAIFVTASERTQKLTSVPGTLGRTWAYWVVLFWADFPGMHADLRLNDPRPVFTVAMEQTPKHRLFLAKCRTNTGDRNRSVKMGRAGVFTYKGLSAPDEDWTIPFEAAEIKPGLWKLTPSRDLAPGEYGWFSGMAAAYATKGNPAGELFDFGVDRNL